MAILLPKLYRPYYVQFRSERQQNLQVRRESMACLCSCACDYVSTMLATGRELRPFVLLFGTVLYDNAMVPCGDYFAFAFPQRRFVPLLGN